MKKHMNTLLKLKPEELLKKRLELREEIGDLSRGMKTGDVQNTQIAKQKKRELARVEMLIANPSLSSSKEEPTAKDKKPAKKTAAAKEKK